MKKPKKLYICSDGTRFYDGEMCGQHIFCNPGVTCVKVEDVNVKRKRSSK